MPESAADLLATLEEIAAMDLATGAPRAEELWRLLEAAGRLPFVDGDRVVFLYRGDAETVEWRGDFTAWERGLPVAGRWVTGTELWRGTTTLPVDARALYKVVVDGEWILDPANDRRQLGGFGPDSVLVMPEFAATDETSPDADVAPGTLSAGVLVDSAAMGYAISYQVYVPAGYEDLAGLPVLYVTDGSDFSHPDMGAMPIVLDNLIDAGRIAPALAVFVDAWDPERTVNRREVEFLERPADYARFLATELVPAVDAQYRTDPSPAARALVGTSYGGVGGIAAILYQPDVFGTLAMFSPALWAIVHPEELGDPARIAPMQELAVLVDEAGNCGPGTGKDCGQLRLFMTSGVPDWDVGDLSEVAAGFDDFGYDSLFIQVSEGHNWAQWSALTDEMLEFVLG